MKHSSRIRIHLLCGAFLIAAACPSFGAGTAYEALRAVKTDRGNDFLKGLVEVRGTRGEPQPSSWTLLFNAPDARGGVREIVVQNGQILSERTPVRGFSGIGDLPTLPYDRLNIDSDGVFRLVNAEAAKQGAGFHWVDYTLRGSTDGKGAIWSVELIDYLGAPVGNMQISAENLRVVRGLQIEPDAVVNQATVPPRPSSSPRGGAIGRVEEFGKSTSNKVRRGTLNVIGSVEEWLTGERTIGTEEE